MTSKLDMWKAALTEYETAHEIWVSDKTGDWAIHERYIDARDHIEGNAPDYLRTLIAVAEAAATLRTAISNDVGIIRPPDVSELEELFETLKALE